MTRYELKKVFSQRINQIAAVLLAALTAFCIWLGMTSVSYSVVDNTLPDGARHLSGAVAAARLREDAIPYCGAFTEDVLRQVISDNQAVQSLPEAQSDSIPDKNYIYMLTQGYRDIRSLVAGLYVGFQDYDYYTLDHLQPEDADRLYTLRTQNLMTWLDSEDINLSPVKQQFLIDRYNALETPMTYHPYNGWESISEYAPTLLMVMTFLIGFLVAGIFAREKQHKADAIFYSTYHGRKKAVWAKVKAGLVITNGAFWTCTLVYSGVLLLLLSASGWDTPIQFQNRKSFYNITMLQRYLLMVLGGWVSVNFISLLCMLVSAKTNSSMVSVSIPFAIMFAPVVLSGIHAADGTLIANLISLLPDQLLQVSVVLNRFNLYNLFGNICGSIHILPWLYLIFSLLLIPAIYRVYRKKQVT